MRIHNASFEEAGAQVLGISCDSRPTQVAFASSLGFDPLPASGGLLASRRGMPEPGHTE